MKRILALCMALSLTAAAAWSAPLTLDRETCIDLALENNADFLSALIDLETAARKDRNAWNEFLPDISAKAGLAGDSSLFDSSDDDLDWNFSSSVSLSLSLDSSLGYTIKRIGLEYENEEISLEEARQSLIAEVEKEFYSLLASEQDIIIEETNKDIAWERYEQSQTKFDYGLATELEVLQARVTATNLEPTYLQTVADYEAQVREFLIVLGLDPDAEVVLEGSLDTPEFELDADELCTGYIGSRTDVRSAENTLETMEVTGKETVASNCTPSLGLSASWSSSISDAFDAGSWDYDSWSDGLSVGIDLTIPLDDLIPGSSSSVSNKSARDEIDKAALSLNQARNDARAEIINLVAQLETSAANVELSALNVELARRTYELSEQSYAMGTTQRLDVEDAQASYMEAEQDLLMSRYELISGLIDLRVALGVDSLDGLL